MKLFLLFFFLFGSAAAFAGFDREIKVLSQLKAETQKLIEKAKACVPEKNKLCTGVEFSEERWKFFQKMTFDSCKNEIIKQNYRLQKGTSEFTGPTLRAETIYKDRTVLFKEGIFNKIDCLHELFHIYQHDSTLKSDLAPVQRAKLEAEILKHLESSVTFVTEIEKSGKKKKAQAMSEKVTPFIEVLKNLKAMEQWFDEKDVHFFIYGHCYELKCNLIDRDVALSNLYRLRPYFPSKEATQIERDSLALVRLKQVEAVKQARKKWKRLDIDDETISQLLTLSWMDLFSKIKKEGLTIQKVESPFKIKGLEKYAIDSETFKKLPSSKEAFSSNSKLTSGEAFAKFVPSADGKIILLTPLSTKTSLVHEYLHFLQVKANPSYGETLLLNGSLASDFENGKMTREAYEEKALAHNALVWLAEREVYERLLSQKKYISPLEDLNNKELFQQYDMKLKVNP